MSIRDLIGAQAPYLAKKYSPLGAAPRSFTDIPEAGAQVLMLTDFTIATQVIGFAADRPAVRHIFTNEGDNFNKGSFFRFSAAGNLVMFYRTPAGSMVASTAGVFDDGVWHNVAMVRDSGGPIFRLFVDGNEEATDVTDPGITIGVVDSAWGNWNVNGTVPEPDEPFLRRLASSFVVDAPMTIPQMNALLNSAGVDLPVGMTILNRLAFPGADDTTTVIAEIGP